MHTQLHCSTANEHIIILVYAVQYNSIIDSFLNIDILNSSSIVVEIFVDGVYRQSTEGSLLQAVCTTINLLILKPYKENHSLHFSILAHP